MDTRQIEYILQIAEENNITKAAEKLFITQSALNQQLLKLERELGTPLFQRTKNKWCLTDAGRIYVAGARKMMQIKKDTYNKIHDLAKNQQGELSVGFTPGRGIAMFSSVYPKFHQMHPDIRVIPMELSVHKQHSMLLSDNLDLGFVTLAPSSQKASLAYIPLTSEKILAAVPARYPVSSLSLDSDSFSPFPEIDLYALREEPFVLTYQESTLRELTDEIFKKANFKPHVLFETASNETITTMVSAELCCGILPSFYVKRHQDNIHFFSLPDDPTWNVMACYHKNRYYSKAAKDFVTLAEEFWIKQE